MTLQSNGSFEVTSSLRHSRLSDFRINFKDCCLASCEMQETYPTEVCVEGTSAMGGSAFDQNLTSGMTAASDGRV